MYTLFLILVLFAAVLMCLIVLIQNSKGGGLASNFASSNQIMGVRKTTDFLEKTTWGLAAAIAIFSICASISLPKSVVVENSVIQQNAVENSLVNPMAVPGFTQDAPAEAPAAAPAETPAAE
ncbi:MAG: preprotein translocase subunit SecG [Bacteroidaceae bacterium]|nr:preprotein translocase subunit SecG [Bacteroidaceae bacterium]MBR3855694.1 preprotein translocase subunit SecG [Bacteroidaceae bacterium]